MYPADNKEPTPVQLPSDSALNLMANLEVFDIFPLPVVAIDTHGRCVYSNKKFAEISGIERFRDHHVKELFPGDENQRIVEEQLKKRFENLQPDEYDATATRLADCREIPVRIASTPVVNSSGKVLGAIAIFRELTVEQAVARVDKAIGGQHDTKGLLETISLEITKLIPFQRLHVSVYSNDFQHVRSLYSYPYTESGWPKIRWYKMSNAMARFAANEEVVLIDDMDKYYKDPNFLEADAEILKSKGWADRSRSLLRRPLVVEGQVVASISIGRGQPNSFNRTDEEVFRALPFDRGLNMALYFEAKKDLQFRLGLMKNIFDNWENQEQVAAVIVQRLLDRHDWDHAAFFQVDEKRREARLLSQKAKLDDPTFLLPRDYRQSLEKGILGHVYQAKKLVNIGNIERDDQFAETVVRGFDAKIRSELCLPVVLNNRVSWMLNLEDTRENAFSADEVREVDTILDELKNLLSGVMARHFLDATIASASDAVIVVDGGGQIIRVNSAVEKLLGFSQTELQDKPFLQVFGSKRLLGEVIEGRRLNSEQSELRSKAGVSVPVLLSASPLPQALRGAVFLARDLSLVKRLEELEYLGRMYREIAMQTKTPLSLAFSWLSQLKDQERDPQVLQVLQALCSELDKVELTYDRLALYEQNQGLLPFTEMMLKLSEIKNRVLDTFPNIEKVKILSNIDDSFPPIRGDIYQLTFCCRTVLSYLIRFVPEKQHIRFDAIFDGRRIAICISGFLPTASDFDYRGRGNEWLPRILLNIALGEQIIRSFIQRNNGWYYEPVRNNETIEFRFELPALLDPIR